MSILPLTSSRQQARYVRINPKLTEDPPRLDDVSRLKYLQGTVRPQIGEMPSIERLARQLIATCFYFEKSKPAQMEDDSRVLHQGKFQTR